MVVGDFDVVRVAVFPSEANAPLAVNAYAVLAFAVAGEGFEVIAGRNSE